MLGFSTMAELRLAAWAAVALGAAGVLLWQRHAGYEECHRPEVAAAKAQKASDAVIDQGVTDESKQRKDELVVPGGPAGSLPPHLIVRDSGCVPARPTTARARPVTPPPGGDDRGMLVGIEAEAPVDVGPVMQDFALAGVLRATEGDLLWKRAIEQAQGPPKR